MNKRDFYTKDNEKGDEMHEKNNRPYHSVILPIHP